MNKKIFITVVLALLIAATAGAYLYMTETKERQTVLPSPTPIETSVPQTAPPATLSVDEDLKSLDNTDFDADIDTINKDIEKL